MNTLVGKIDVTKMDKEKFFKGSKGTYCDIVLIPTPNNQYGDDYMICQSVSKEEREAGQRGAILGNAKMLVSESGRPKDTYAEQKQVEEAHVGAQPSFDDSDSLPF
jgi:hypothetical protein